MQVARTVGTVGLVFSAVFFAASQIALPQASTPLPLQNRSRSVSDIRIPATLGYITETHAPVQQAASRILIHIQEAHTNEEAQRHLAQILQHLVEQYGLRLILVEGGKGDVNLSYLRRYSPPARRKQVAEQYLKLGLLNGEEYLDLTSEAPLILWGVERWDLYQEHLKTFLAIQPLQDELSPVIAASRQAVERLKLRLYDAKLLELERHTELFDQKTLGLAEHVEQLAALAGQSGVSLDPTPQVQRFLALRKLEQQITLPEVQREQQALLQALSRSADRSAFEALIATGRAAQAEQVEARAAFYAELERLAQASGIALAQYPHLADYLRYLAESGHVNPPQLSTELDTLAQRVRASLITTPEGRQLAQLDEALRLCDRLVALKLSPEDYDRIQPLFADPAMLGQGVAFLNEQLRHAASSSAPVPSLEALSAQWPVIRKFYELAQARDHALVENTIAKLDDSHERMAVLITGGFHGPRIAQMLRERGLGLVMVATKMTQTTDDRLYESVIRFKSGRGTFAEVEAAAKSVSSESVSREQETLKQ